MRLVPTLQVLLPKQKAMNAVTRVLKGGSPKTSEFKKQHRRLAFLEVLLIPIKLVLTKEHPAVPISKRSAKAVVLPYIPGTNFI